MKIKALGKDLLMSFSMALIYVSGIFLSDILSFSMALTGLYIVFTAALYALAAVGRDSRTAFIKWAVSVPFAYLVIQYFRRTDYAIRSLNWLYPGYGRQSAGGAFAALFNMLALSVLCLPGIIAGANAKPEVHKRLQKIQPAVIISADIIITSAVLILESRFPPIELILS